jgi:hypothetical protein
MDDRGKLTWWKSSKSSGGACVEVARGEGGLVHVRHSKDPDGPCLTLDSEAFRAFIAYVKETGPADR